MMTGRSTGLLLLALAVLIFSGCVGDIFPPYQGGGPPCDSLVASVAVIAPRDSVYLGRGGLVGGIARDRSGTAICKPSIFSDNESVLAVLSAGAPLNYDFVIGTGLGSAHIIASVGRLRDTVLVTVWAPPSPFVAVTAGGRHTCGLDGRIIFCWGFFSPAAEAAQSSPGVPIRVSGALRFVSLNAGGRHTCALDSLGKAYCWGQGCELGIGNCNTMTDTLIAVATPLQFQTIAPATGGHTCAIAVSGVGYCWGANDAGQLGTASTVGRSVPGQVSGDLRFTRLSGGVEHTCGITVDSLAYCWGSNEQGALGSPAAFESCNGQPCSTQPLAVSGGLRFTAIATGFGYSCGVARSGTAYCWGANAEGQLGTGDSAATIVPVAVVGGHAFRSVVVAWAHTCGVLTDSSVMCWGRGAEGELGNGSMIGTPVPVAIQGGLRFVTLTAGSLFRHSGHTCGIVTTGGAYCWGYGGDGQLGNGDWIRANSSVPVRVSGQP